jgi:hypothetical protein
VDKRKRKKEDSPAGTFLGFAHRYNYSCEEKPAGSICSCWLRRLLFATQRDDLCGQFHVVYPGRYNYSCSSVLVSLYL